MSGRPIRCLAAVAAAGMTAALLPLGVAPANAEAAAFGGFNAGANATPIRVEVYEPTIPIPDQPQAEFRLSYTKTNADSGTSAGRASWLWPGDPVGEGAKTFMEQVGLPAELAAAGYPIQVNSSSPAGEGSAADEPFPGMVMRTKSEEGSASASAGFSPDGDVDEKEAADSGPPSGLDALGPLGELLTPPSGARTSSSTAEEESAPSIPGLPPELAALVDVDGMYSTSKSSMADDKVLSTARANLGEVSLLAGIVRVAGVDVRSTSTSDGSKGVNGGKATYGTLSLADQEFTIGPDGVEASGESTPIPGLSDNPAKALEQLGLTIVVPEPTREVDGDLARSTVEGLRIEIDTKVLKPVISAIPSMQLAQLLPVPEEAGALKSLVGALSGLSPRVVITLGVAESMTNTVPMIELPALPELDTGAHPPADADGGAGLGTTGGGAGGTTGGDVGGLDAGSAPADGGGASGTLDSAVPASATPGLPPLNSIPGMLLFGSIALAAVVGSYLRKIGALALGAGAPCSHGLDSGLPDLRKM